MSGWVPEQIIHRRWVYLRGVVDTPIGGNECWKCERPSPDLAHAVYEYVAALLAQRLVRVLDEHEATCEVCRATGAAWCAERDALSDLLPEAYHPVAIG